VRSKTDYDTALGPRLVGTRLNAHFDDWLTQLPPRIVVFIRRWAADRSAAASTLRRIPFKWLSRQLNLSTDVPEPKIVDVVRAMTT